MSHFYYYYYFEYLLKLTFKRYSYLYRSKYFIDVIALLLRCELGLLWYGLHMSSVLLDRGTNI